MTRLAVALTLTLVPVVNAQSVPDIATVLERAQNYVTRYEEELGNLIGQEEYSQSASWQGSRGLTERRRMSSDFLLVRTGETWFGTRNVLRVDGLRVDAKKKNSADLLGGPPETLRRQLSEIDRDNARYNVGDFLRTFNVPTFPLTLLVKANLRRFSFEKISEKKLENVKAWEIRFVEVGSPTLLRGFNGEDRAQHGRLWIEPETGRVLRTENVVDAKEEQTTYQARIVVTYKVNAKLGMLVPAEMEETYTTRAHRVDALARYSNFRRFATDVKLDVKID